MEGIMVVHDDSDPKEVWVLKVHWDGMGNLWDKFTEALEEWSETESCYEWCMDRDDPYFSALEHWDIPENILRRHGIFGVDTVNHGDGYKSEVTVLCKNAETTLSDRH